MAMNIQSGIMQGVSSAVAVTQGMTAGAARATIEQNIVAIRDQNQRFYASASELAGKSGDDIKAAIRQQIVSGSGLFANITTEQENDMGKDPSAFVNEAARTFQIQANAADDVFTVYSERMNEYTQQFGMNSNQVFDLARESGINLMDVTTDFTTSMNQLVSALINSTVELNAYIGEVYADMYESTQDFKKAAEGPLIYDEAARTVFDQAAQAGGKISPQMLAEFFGVATQQFPAMYSEFPLRGLIEFPRQFQRGGLAFSTPGTPFYGMEEQFYSPENAGLTERLVTQSKVGASTAAQEILISGLNAAGLRLEDPTQAVNFGARFVERALVDPDGATRDILTLMQKQDELALATDDTVKERLKSDIATLLSDAFGMATVEFKTAESTAALQADAVYRGIIDAFAPGFRITSATTDISTPYAGVTAGSVTVQDGNDTRTPVAPFVGDTGTNLSKTLDSHRRLNGMAGNRFITSSYRNFALGSSNSDHINGRAYDLVGDNLISYRDAVKRDGGFAEFHGDKSSRHLHVVPRIGDSMLPAYTMATGIASAAGPQSDGGNTYNITVNGAGSNPEEIANMVIHKIKTTEKVNRERSY